MSYSLAGVSVLHPDLRRKVAKLVWFLHVAIECILFSHFFRRYTSCADSIRFRAMSITWWHRLNCRSTSILPRFFRPCRQLALVMRPDFWLFCFQVCLHGNLQFKVQVRRHLNIYSCINSFHPFARSQFYTHFKPKLPYSLAPPSELLQVALVIVQSEPITFSFIQVLIAAFSISNVACLFKHCWLLRVAFQRIHPHFPFHSTWQAYTTCFCFLHRLHISMLMWILNFKCPSSPFSSIFPQFSSQFPCSCLRIPISKTSVSRFRCDATTIKVARLLCIPNFFIFWL
jgi:hypothetical protein